MKKQFCKKMSLLLLVMGIITGTGMSKEFTPQAIYTPNGKFVVSSSSGGTIRLWNVKTGQEIDRSSRSKKQVYGPDGKSYVIVSSDDGMISLRRVNEKTGQMEAVEVSVSYLTTLIPM